MDESAEALLVRVADRDGAALKLLYGQCASQLFAVLLNILRRRDLAEDALQDVFMRIWNDAAGYRPSHGKAIAWLTSVARNRAIDILRRRRFERSIDSEDSISTPEAPVEDDPAFAAEWGSEATKLRQCMDELSADQSGSIRLAFLRGYSHAEVSQAVGAPVGTVKSWIRRGLNTLKACVSR